MELIAHWIDWKEVYGRKHSRQRREIDRLLEARPMLMYLGDSWFSTPLYRNLAKQSAASADSMGIVLGKPGGLASELFSENELEWLEDRLEGSPFDALVIGAGGNDSLSDRLENVLADWMAERPGWATIAVDDAFNILLDADIFDDGHESGIIGHYSDLLQVATRILRTRTRFRVIGHTYAPLKRIGVPADLLIDNLGLAAFIKGSAGPWMWSVMKRVLRDEEAGREFARKSLVDGFKHRVLDQVAREFSGLFSYAAFSTLDGIEDDAFWYDEIHPNDVGFARMAPVLNERIREALPQAKWGAVR